MIEPRELFKNGTAERVDFQFKSIVLQMMQERLPEIPIEAYDKDFQVVEGQGWWWYLRDQGFQSCL